MVFRHVLLFWHRFTILISHIGLWRGGSLRESLIVLVSYFFRVKSSQIQTEDTIPSLSEHGAALPWSHGGQSRKKSTMTPISTGLLQLCTSLEWRGRNAQGISSGLDREGRGVESDWTGKRRWRKPACTQQWVRPDPEVEDKVIAALRYGEGYGDALNCIGPPAPGDVAK